MTEHELRQFFEGKNCNQIQIVRNLKHGKDVVIENICSRKKIIDNRIEMMV